MYLILNLVVSVCCSGKGGKCGVLYYLITCNKCVCACSVECVTFLERRNLLPAFVQVSSRALIITLTLRIQLCLDLLQLYQGSTYLILCVFPVIFLNKVMSRLNRDEKHLSPLLFMILS